MHATQKMNSPGPQSGRMMRLFWPEPITQPAMNTSEHEARATTSAGIDAVAGVTQLTRNELGLRVAIEVMNWHSDHEQFADCWVDADGKLTGYYYGRPFSPYRDRNALVEVWKRLEALKLQDVYVRSLGLLLEAQAGAEANPAWALHTCDPEIACRAALLAVRTAAAAKHS